MQLYESAFVTGTTTSISARFETMENCLFIKAKQQVMNVTRQFFKQPLMSMKSVANDCQSYLKPLQSESQKDFQHVWAYYSQILRFKVGSLVMQFAAVNGVVAKDENELAGEILKSPMRRCLGDTDVISYFNSLGGRQEWRKDLISHCSRKDLHLNVLNFQY